MSFCLCGCKNNMVRYVYVENPPEVYYNEEILYKKRCIAQMFNGDSVLYYCTNEKLKYTNDSILAFANYVIQVDQMDGLKRICSFDLNGYGDTVHIRYYDKIGKDSVWVDLSNPQDPCIRKCY